MVDIWLTHDAEDAYQRLQSASPKQAAVVAGAIDVVATDPGRPIDLPGVRSPEPLRALVPNDPTAPVVIYRRASREEQGDWLVISLIDRASYLAAIEAERALSSFPTATRTIVNTAVGTAASVSVNALTDRVGGTGNDSS